MKHEHLPPTWVAATRIFCACLMNPNASNDAKQGAQSELLRMAAMFDATQQLPQPTKPKTPARKCTFKRERDDVGGGYGRSDY